MASRRSIPSTPRGCRLTTWPPPSGWACSSPAPRTATAPVTTPCDWEPEPPRRISSSGSGSEPPSFGPPRPADRGEPRSGLGQDHQPDRGPGLRGELLDPLVHPLQREPARDRRRKVQPPRGDEVEHLHQIALAVAEVAEQGDPEERKEQDRTGVEGLQRLAHQ